MIMRSRAKGLETIPARAPVMPVGDGLGGVIADSDAFQLRGLLWSTYVYFLNWLCPLKRPEKSEGA